MPSSEWRPNIVRRQVKKIETEGPHLSPHRLQQQKKVQPAYSSPLPPSKRTTVQRHYQGSGVQFQARGFVRRLSEKDGHRRLIAGASTATLTAQRPLSPTRTRTNADTTGCGRAIARAVTAPFAPTATGQPTWWRRRPTAACWRWKPAAT